MGASDSDLWGLPSFYKHLEFGRYFGRHYRTWTVTSTNYIQADVVRVVMEKRARQKELQEEKEEREWQEHLEKEKAKEQKKKEREAAKQQKEEEKQRLREEKKKA